MYYLSYTLGAGVSSALGLSPHPARTHKWVKFATRPSQRMLAHPSRIMSGRYDRMDFGSLPQPQAAN